jgi:hypothetical protein
VANAFSYFGGVSPKHYQLFYGLFSRNRFSLSLALQTGSCSIRVTASGILFSGDFEIVQIPDPNFLHPGSTSKNLSVLI